MAVEIVARPRMTLTEAARRFGFLVTVKELRDGKWVASIPAADIMRGGFLESSSGHGDTPVEALKRLRGWYSGQQVALHADDPVKRREIEMPILTGEEE